MASSASSDPETEGRGSCSEEEKASRRRSQQKGRGDFQSKKPANITTSAPPPFKVQSFLDDRLAYMASVSAAAWTQS